MRGKGPSDAIVACVSGITPAYAGKSVGALKDRLVTADHPRLCGEKSFQLVQFFLCVGSPPPMRGKVRLRSVCRHTARITPAYAGKRKFADFFGVTTEDHPRLCGEKLSRCRVRHGRTGSPPPMRGKVPQLVAAMVNGGITPAYAGKS